MTGPVFVDTNVFVYRFDTSEPDKQARAEAWLERLWAERAGRLSLQVQQELYVTLTRKLSRPLEPAEARPVVRSLDVWKPVPADRRTLEAAWALEDRHSLSWWDALIVAAAEIAGCPILLSEDLGHGQRFGAVEVVDPFRSAPGGA